MKKKPLFLGFVLGLMIWLYIVLMILLVPPMFHQ